LAIEAVLTGCNDAAHPQKGIAVERSSAIYAFAGCVLQPQAPVDDAAHVWVDTMRAELVEEVKGQIEHVAGADQIRGVAFDQPIAATRGQGEDIEGMAERGPGEEVGRPAVSVGWSSQVFSVLDVEPDMAG
jgi:hypothetical protein